MTGSEVKEYIYSNGLKCWQVAAAFGLTDGNFSRKLRKPFSADDVERLKKIVVELKGEQLK